MNFTVPAANFMLKISHFFSSGKHAFCYSHIYLPFCTFVTN